MDEKGENDGDVEEGNGMQQGFGMHSPWILGEKVHIPVKGILQMLNP